jgi:hypothetical protein
MYVVRTFENESAARAYRDAHGAGGLIFAPSDPSHEAVLFPPGVDPAEALRHPLARGRDGRIVPDGPEPGSDAWYRAQARLAHEIEGLIEVPLYAEVEPDEQHLRVNGEERVVTGAWVTARIWVEDPPGVGDAACAAGSSP